MNIIKSMNLRRYKKRAKENIKEMRKILAKHQTKIDPEKMQKAEAEIAVFEDFMYDCTEPAELESKYFEFDSKINKIVKPFKKSVFREYAEAFIAAIILATIIRTFIVQAFKIPTGSMQPTLHGAQYYGTGDRILVNKFIFGAKSPTGIMFTDIKLPYFQLPAMRQPKHGDVIVFTTAGISLLDKDEQNKDFIKRLVGLPGDRIEIKGLRREMLFVKSPYSGEIERIENPIKVFKDDGIYIEGESARTGHKLINGPIEPDEGIVLVNGEILDDPEIFRYICYTNEGPFGQRFKSIVVPEKSYFVLGDNSPSSKDSRFWGFVPEENLRGMAFFVYWPVPRMQFIK